MKAVFLAGGPGSGKDFIMKKTLEGHGLTEINSDNAFEHLMRMQGLDPMMPREQDYERNLARGSAKRITKEQALKNPELVKPGMVFCYLTKNSSGSHGPAGHTGIVVNVNVQEKSWSGFEGNANPIDGSREGYGTFYIKRKMEDPSISKEAKEKPALLLGFIDYLDGYRKGNDYEEFKNNLNTAASKYSEFTKSEINRLNRDPKISVQHAKNYANRLKK
jgi:hypothetical protein